MSMRWPSLPDCNYRKMKAIARMTDEELYMKHNILARELSAARTYIEKRVADMKRGHEMQKEKKHAQVDA